jgi:hypothetical protein
MTRIAILLRMLLIVGLAVAPLSVHAAASGDRDISHAMDRAAVTMPADSGDMPSDDAAMDCGDMHCPDMHDGKACACFAACATMYALGLPSLAPIAANVPVTSQLMAFSSEEQLASLAAPPPARPPRN